MKNILSILFVCFVGLGIGCNSSDKNKSADEKTEQVSDMKLVKVELKVDGMTCTGCENTLKAKISQLDGVNEVEASHVNGVVQVQLQEGKVEVNAIKEAILAAGYTVKDNE